MDKITQNLEPLKSKLKNHNLYNIINTQEDLKIFCESHVFAVWDFMSLLKKLQIELTSINIPWMPSNNSEVSKLINEIVAGEETDETLDGSAISHYEMYINAINDIGVDTNLISNQISSLNDINTIIDDINKLDIDDYIKEFLKFTFRIINNDKTHEIASAFTFGREDLIPDMFIPLLEKINSSDNTRIDKLIYYFKRHIEVDGDMHGPMAMKMLSFLCSDDETKINESLVASKDALKVRIALWDGIENKILNKK
ncbi:MAG TPA: DUF3050 domain-containing protein [Flavobacteriaceae bacterium]|nr:DUF3050 domain-containing protein [Flavobacteriaceae bacterium]|tara:strand:+ start:65 stop:829 length:765 start_codon:yes stop_codon:yes gene_type:complete